MLIKRFIHSAIKKLNCSPVRICSLCDKFIYCYECNEFTSCTNCNDNLFYRYCEKYIGAVYEEEIKDVDIHNKDS